VSWGGAGALAVLVVGLLASCASGAGASGPPPEARAAFEATTGVKVVRVALTGGGGLVDLRYRVIDAGKAQHVHHIPPTLVDAESGEVIDTLLMDHAHGGQPEAGHTYPLIFVNEQGLIERGGEVAVVIGGTRLEQVAVE
jgi:hypothetical protein